MRRFYAVLAVMVLLGCSDSTSENGIGLQPMEPSFVLAGENACGSGSVPSGQSRYWPCGSTITFLLDSSGLPSTQAFSATELNNALEPEETGLPRLVQLFYPDTFPDLWITSSDPTGNPSAVNWRGAVSIAGKPFKINFADGQSTNGGTLQAVALNELMLVYGLNDAYDAAAVDNVSDHCAFASPPTGLGPCQHDVELIKWIYGIRDDEPDLAKHVVTRLIGLPSQLELDVGDSVDVSLTSLRFERAHPSWPESYSATNANSNLLMTAPPGAHFSVSQISNTTLRFKGISSGTTTGTFRYSSSVFEYTDHVANAAGAVAVTVEPAEYVPTGVLRDFNMAGCSSQNIGGKQYIYFRVRWMNGIPPAGVNSYIIAKSTTTGGSKTSIAFGTIAYDSVGVQRDTLPGIEVKPTNPPLYFWIKQGSKFDGTEWLMVGPEVPIYTDSGCAL